MPLYMRKALLTAKKEAGYGEDAAPGAANAILVREMSVVPVQANLVSRDVVRPYFGNSQQLPVYSSVECAFEVELVGSGAAGTAPGWGLLLEACGCAETVMSAAETDTAQAGTANSITLAAGASSADDSYKGLVLRATGGTGSGQTRLITAYDGTSKIATVADAWGSAPDATTTYSIDAQASYAPISIAGASLSMYYNLDGVQHEILGARGTVSVEVNAGGIPVLRFRFMGLYTDPNDTPAVVPDYSAFQIPDPVNIPNTPQFRLHGAASPMSALSADLANNLVFRSLPGGVEQTLITDRRPAGSVTFEATTIAANDWFTAARVGTTAPLSLIHGAAAGKIVHVEAPGAQITNPQYQDLDGIAMLQCGLVLTPLTGNDELFIVAR